jgi:hypothetical protein
MGASGQWKRPAEQPASRACSSGSTSQAALHLLGNVEVLGRGRAIKGLPVIAVSTVLTAVTVVPVNILHVPVPITRIRAAAPVAVAVTPAVTVVVPLAIIVAIAVTPIILTWRVIAHAAARRRRPAARRSPTKTAVAVAARVEAPGRRRRGASPLDLQHIVATDPLVMHLMVRVVRITTILVLHEREESARSRSWGRDVATDKAPVAIDINVSKATA